MNHEFRYFSVKGSNDIHPFTNSTPLLITRGEADEVFPNKTDDEISGTTAEATIYAMTDKLDIVKYVLEISGKQIDPKGSLKALQAVALDAVTTEA